MNNGLRDYFNGVSDVIATKAKLAGLSAENIDIGTNREIICKEFLEEHIPKRYSINLGGDIFGIGGQRSGQIDIIINHDISLAFQENHKFLCPVEVVTSAISVKSYLNKAELENALRNLASIPQCEPETIKVSLLGKPVCEYILSWPASFIFVYEGVSLETCLEHLRNFCNANQVSFNRIPRAIVVNGKYIIAFLHDETQNASTQMLFQESCLRFGSPLPESRGYPLFWMMIELAKGLSWLNGMYLNYSRYYEEAFLKTQQTNVGD